MKLGIDQNTKKEESDIGEDELDLLEESDDEQDDEPSGKDAVLKITKKRSNKSKVEPMTLDKYIEATNSGNANYTVDRIDSEKLFEALTCLA